MLESYFYKGISEQKYVEGDIEAYSLDEAADKLKNDRIIITHLTKVKKKKKAADKNKKKSSFFKAKVKPGDVVIFSKQFATMIKAGLPILQILTMLRDQITNPSMKEIIEEIRSNLEGGLSLSKCFSKYPDIFDNIYINLIKAGEASGKLDVFMLKLVESLEKKRKNQKEN